MRKKKIGETTDGICDELLGGVHGWQVVNPLHQQPEQPRVVQVQDRSHAEAGFTSVTVTLAPSLPLTPV